MRLKVTIRQSIITALIFILLMGVLFPNVIALPIMDSGEGIWEDTFNDSTGLTLNDTTRVNGSIELIKNVVNYRTYDFADNFNHYAYSYRTMFFLPNWNLFSPISHVSQEFIFDKSMIGNIKTLNKKNATWDATWINHFVIQHFRFQLLSTADVIDKIGVSWYGKATDNAIIKFYFWNSSRFINGAWQNLGIKIGGNNLRFSRNITHGDIAYALDAKNYIDICVVASLNRIHLSPCSLSTDYIQLNSTGEKGFKTIGGGSVETKNPIIPKDISPHFNGYYWEILTWDDYQNEEASIRYQLLYEYSSNKYVPVPDKYFLNNPESNNSNGFTHPPVYLNAIPFDKLKIKAIMKSNSPIITPRIFNWAITWQESGQWHDSFNTSYRVDKKNKVLIANSIITISKIQGEWPMFGFNSENNRATIASGPSSTDTLYWYDENVGGGFRNPVIGNGKVYIVSNNSRTIYQYNMELASGVSRESIQNRTSSHNFDYDIVNSPAVTEDKIIIATGQMDKGGFINHIYALRRENISKTPLWDFSNGITAICYFSSPVVAGDKIFITSWGGDNGAYIDESNRYTNNKLLALDLETGNSTWQKELSAPSYSTPAVSLSSDIVIAGCDSSNNQSLFAFSLDGTPLWSKKIGAIGHTSPVIYDNMVFVIATSQSLGSLKTNIYGLNLTNGDSVWNKTICSSIQQFKNIGDSTPTIFDDVLYVASPDGTLFAFHASNGTELWSQSVYIRSMILSPQSLISSPVYANGNIYIGTPSVDGLEIIALTAATGEKTGFSFTTFYKIGGGRNQNSPILGSPIVSNGLLFVADEDGRLYSIGSYKAPSTQIEGSITSIPITLPGSFSWNRFYAYAIYNKTISGITYKLLDENNNILRDLQNGTILPITLPRTLLLRADFTTKNISTDNPRLLSWKIIFTKDAIPPYLYPSTTPPFNNGTVVPRISIKVKDNDTGLLVNSAQYTLQYILNNITNSNTFSARCSGTNGTTQVQNITANISAIPDYANITSLNHIIFSIKDLAGNTATKSFEKKGDINPPSSYVIKSSMKPRYNASVKFIWINATSFDNGTNASGIQKVELYYRYSSTGKFTGNWVYFAYSTKKSPHWKFNFTSNSKQHGGYFEVCTVATDNASNNESFPARGDVSFLYDWKIPDLPSFSGDTLWFKEALTYSVLFEDDFRLDTIQYRPNFETLWITIATDVNASTYNKSWSLKEEYWAQMNEGEVYYLYFKINDTLGNTLNVTSNNQAISFRKDTSEPNGTIDIPSVENEISLSYNFTVSGLVIDQDGSGIKEVTLYYRFSEDNSNWSNWTVYGDTLGASPFEWEYSAAEGDGYYEFKINVTDIAGNSAESKVFPVEVISFPITLTLVMIGLVIVFSIISAVIFIKWRKRK